jgi:hypothetical protein
MAQVVHPKGEEITLQLECNLKTAGAHELGAAPFLALLLSARCPGARRAGLGARAGQATGAGAGERHRPRERAPARLLRATADQVRNGRPGERRAETAVPQENKAAPTFHILVHYVPSRP